MEPKVLIFFCFNVKNILRKKDIIDLRGLYSLVCPSFLEVTKMIISRKGHLEVEGEGGFKTTPFGKLALKYADEWRKSIEICKTKDPSHQEFSDSLSHFEEIVKSYSEMKIVIFIDEAQVLFR